MKPGRIVKTEDGSSTIYLEEIDEHYHSTFGAIQEANTVFIDPGLVQTRLKNLKILEIGFGTGLNALLSALKCKELNMSCEYTTLEKYPLEAAQIAKLNYPEQIGGDAGDIYNSINKAPWDLRTSISDTFLIHKLETDARLFQSDIKFDIIYFDAFAPAKQPEMWEDEIINNISGLCSSGGLFLTYSARGALKRQLISSGFNVERIPGPPGKREITRAVRI